MAKKLFIPEQKIFLEENAKGRYYAELAALFNERFNTDYNRVQIKNFCLSLGLKNGLPRVKGGHYWTEEELSFLKKNAKENANKELTILFNNAFNLSLTRRQVKYACWYNKIKTREQAPVKCTKEIAAFIQKNSAESVPKLTVMINNTFKTAFTKKQVAGFLIYYKHKVYYNNSPHTAALGSERIKSAGHIYVKVSATGTWKERWKKKHCLIWEAANGEVPEGKYIIFLDGNRQNCALENLAMVSKTEKFFLSLFRLQTDNRETTLAGIAVVKHFLAIHNRLKKMLGSKDHTRFISRESAKRTRGRLRTAGGLV